MLSDNNLIVIIGSLIAAVVIGAVLAWWRRASAAPKITPAVDDDFWNEDSPRKGKKSSTKARPKKSKPDKSKSTPVSTPNGHVVASKQAKASPAVVKAASNTERQEKNETSKGKQTPVASSGRKQAKSQLQSAESPVGDWTVAGSKRKPKSKKDEETKDADEKVAEAESVAETPVVEEVALATEEAVPPRADVEEVNWDVKPSVAEQTTEPVKEDEKTATSTSDADGKSPVKTEKASTVKTAIATRDADGKSPAKTEKASPVKTEKKSPVKTVSPPPTVASSVVVSPPPAEVLPAAETATLPPPDGAEDADADDVGDVVGSKVDALEELADAKPEIMTKTAAKKKKKKNKAAKDTQQATVMENEVTGDVTTSASTGAGDGLDVSSGSAGGRSKTGAVEEQSEVRLLATDTAAAAQTSPASSRTEAADGDISSQPAAVVDSQSIPAAAYVKSPVVFDELGDEPQLTTAANKKKKKPRRDN